MKLKDILEENIGGLVTIKPLGNMFGEEKSTDLLKIAKEGKTITKKVKKYKNNVFVIGY